MDNANYNTNFGTFLKELRLREKVSVAQLSERTGLSPSNIRAYEADRVNPSVENYFKIVSTLGYTIYATKKKKKEGK